MLGPCGAGDQGPVIELFQTVEYLRAFLIGRLALSQVDALNSVSGAFGIFRRDVAVAVGGRDAKSLGEDLEIIIAFRREMLEQKREHRIQFIAEPVCRTQVPSALRPLIQQRSRWQRGSVETFFRHKKMFFNARDKRIGTVGFGQMLISDVLGPIAELLG